MRIFIKILALSLIFEVILKLRYNLAQLSSKIVKLKSRVNIGEKIVLYYRMSGIQICKTHNIFRLHLSCLQVIQSLILLNTRFYSESKI